MRIVFMGTPDFAVPTLDALAAAGHALVAAYTQPPRPAGRRGRELVPSPVQRRAEALGVPVRSPVSLKGTEEQAAFAALAADVAVVAAYGLILPRAVLAAPRHGCLNVHGSLLPRWRGAAPVQRAILAGDAETGVGIMQMEAGLDTGPVRLEARTAVAGKTAGELTAELAELGAALMARVLGDLDAFPPVPQSKAGITYAAKVEKAEMRLDWSRPAEQVERQVRALNPPGMWFEVGGERVRVLEAEVTEPSPACGIGLGEGLSARTPIGQALTLAGLDDPSLPLPQAGEGYVLDDLLTIACASGAIRPTLVQRAGGKPLSVADFLRGFPIPPGTQLE